MKRYSKWLRTVTLAVVICWGEGADLRAEAGRAKDGDSLEEVFDPARLEREVLVTGLSDPLQMTALPNGDVLIIEMQGVIKRWRSATGDTVEVGRVPVTMAAELGLLGIAAAGDFLKSGNIFLFFCPAKDRGVLRLARFTMGADGLLVGGSEKLLLEYPIEFNGAIHMGGGLFFDEGTGNLILGTGDNSPPSGAPPVDVTAQGLLRDSLRSSGNSLDLRGKILRIRPRAEGGYDIPEGNLFRDPKEGRPEIFAMGVRNGFHSSVDPQTGWIAWGDVGPNTDPKTGSVGYDEFNVATKAGNFGHPMFTGPNEAYQSMGVDGKEGGLFEAAHPRNLSPRNSGVKDLPPAMPALLWYPSGASKEFPELGSGGRSAMAGPFYHGERGVKAGTHLPSFFDRGLFVYDWTRNWIKVVRLTTDGKLAGLEAFAPQFAFRKPIDLKIAPDQTLLVLEYGDKWHGNKDGQLSRIIYRRGNRAPVGRLRATPLAGKSPLEVRFDATTSSDPDGDALTFLWDFGGGKTSVEPTPRFPFTALGQQTVSLRVTDARGAVSEMRTVITVGNAPPVVEILRPVNGGFFSEGETIPFEIRVSDVEDGRSDRGEIEAARVSVRGSYRAARSGDAVHPGLALMKRGTCFACHSIREKSVGPAYGEVARKYEKDGVAGEKLAAKILAGGSGVWGKEMAMPPHPQYTLAEAQRMVDWILGLPRSAEAGGGTGFSGTMKSAGGGERQEGGVFVIGAGYADRGAEGALPLEGKAEHILHARKRKAALYDAGKGVEVVDFFEGFSGLAARLQKDGWVQFSQVNLQGIGRLTFHVNPLSVGPVSLEVRADSVDGPLVARTGPMMAGGGFREVSVAVTDPEGVHDLVLVARAESGEKAAVLDVNTVHFQAGIQGGFFTPARKGKLWDTWAYYYEGKYYLYYLGGDFLHWDRHGLARSDDGVYWKDAGVTIPRNPGVTWMGTGHIWEGADFAKNPVWVSNYSEHIGEKQDIRFATSTDLIHWTKADEASHFVQDTRWYKEKGRWDCLDTIKRPDGSFYGYFTADPDPAKVKYRACGFGFGESKDGIHWTALPPVEGDISGEFGGIEKIGERYFILVSEGRVAVGDRPEGPFFAQKKNPNLFGEGCDIYFPRFFHSAPGGPLVNHFYNNGFGGPAPVYAAPFKSVSVDAEGILRLKWWVGNEQLKTTELANQTVMVGPTSKRLATLLDLERTHLVEGTLEPQEGKGASMIYFEVADGVGCGLRFRGGVVEFGTVKADGSDFQVSQVSDRSLAVGALQTFRLLFKGDMVELYLNDYLMNLKRLHWNGRLGFIGVNSGEAFQRVRVWESQSIVSGK